MRLPDTVLPDGLDPFEVQEAYRALKGHALRTEVYADDGSAGGGQPLHGHRAELHLRLPAAPGTEPARGVLTSSPRETLSFSYERGPGRPAGQPRADPGDRRVRQRAAERLRRLPAPGRVRAARAGAAAPTPGDARPTTRRGCTCGGPSAATPTRSTTRAPGRTPTGCRCPRRPTRPRSPASPRPVKGSRDHQTCSPSTRSTAPAASGRPPGRRPRHRLRAGPGVRRRRDRDAAGRRRPGGSSPGSGSCTAATT